MPLWINKFHQWLLKVESIVLVGLIFSIIALTVVQIMIRNVYGTGILWAESYIRISVLWVALFGAMQTSKNNQHIAIDLITHYVSNHLKIKIQALTSMATAIICLIIAYYSYRFTKMEWEDGGIAFASIPNWVCETILPFSFFIMACRFFLFGILSVSSQKH